ncbi:MAG: CinA family protein [Nitrospiraceae bacterium]|nr:CinA family protein [Nitrospiraceae bacterium]
MDSAEGSLVRQVHEVFKERGLFLSVAESCTGGLLAHLITQIPGASDFFLAGIVAYSSAAKMKLLGIKSGPLTEYGTVSSQIAMEMARRAREATGSDYALSTTGNLGPSTLEGKPEGLIYVAVSGGQKEAHKELRLSLGREGNKHQAAMEGLRLLLDTLK